MRGVPNDPVQCKVCGSPEGNRKDQQCSCCRLKLVNPRTKFVFTAEYDERLRAVYADHSHNKRDLTKAITSLVKLTGFPRNIICMRAQRLGISYDMRRPWTKEEIELLREHAGVKPVRRIARALGRAHTSVAATIDRLKLTRRVSEGYARYQVAQVFGVSNETVEKWLDADWLQLERDTNRVTEKSIKRFIQQHPEQFSLKRVDEAWFKGMIFPAFGLAQARKQPQQSERLFPFSWEYRQGGR